MISVQRGHFAWNPQRKLEVCVITGVLLLYALSRLGVSIPCKSFAQVLHIISRFTTPRVIFALKVKLLQWITAHLRLVTFVSSFTTCDVVILLSITDYNI